MNAMDLGVRNASTRMHYRQMYMDGIETFSDYERHVIKRGIASANRLLEGFRNINTIDWVFAKLNNSIENGFPHTLGNVIFVSSHTLQTEHFVKTLIHEKIHVYQRLFPEYTHALVHMYWGYTTHSRKTDIDDARNNPDLDEFVYSSNGKSAFYMRYNDNPTNLNDASVFSVVNEVYEHPFERMAYQISECVYKEQCPEGPLHAWMSKYL